MRDSAQTLNFRKTIYSFVCQSMHYAASHRDVFLTNIVQIFPTLVHNIHSFALYFLILVVATLLNECCPAGRGVPPPPPPPGHYRIVLREDINRKKRFLSGVARIP